MIAKQAFGSTGHASSRILFGAAALWSMKPSRVEKTFELLDRYGVNHIDVAASYGDAELKLAPWLASNRERVFLASKTGDRSGPAARASLEASLERMGVAQLDLIQLHNLVDEAGWREAMAPDGALAALVQARDEGLVRFLGVTGHGTQAPAMHLRSLAEFEFASVLCPLNYVMMADAEYRKDFEKLQTRCLDGGVAIQTIKAIARRRWNDGPDAKPHFSWYEPLQEVGAITRAVAWVLSHEGAFLNSSSDGRLLEPVLAAANDCSERPSAESMQNDLETHAIEPIFVRGVSDSI